VAASAFAFWKSVQSSRIVLLARGYNEKIIEYARLEEQK